MTFGVRIRSNHNFDKTIINERHKPDAPNTRDFNVTGVNVLINAWQSCS